MINFAWFLLFPVLLTFIVGSFCTYHKPIRDNSAYPWIYVIVSALAAWIWCVSVRKLDDPSKILLYSMVWDLLMVAAFYAGPLIAQGNRLSWQAWAATAATVGGIIWFKLATEK
jgi:FtsH-binding integral membrane protein